jgi:hypothetical protein
VTALAAVAHPGDYVLIGFKTAISQVQAERVKARLVELAPDINLAIIDQVAEMAVVRKST